MSTPDRRRFYSYSRVSKVGERDELISPELQQRTHREYAARNDIELIDPPIVDLDETGRSFEKRKIKDIIAGIERGDAVGVLLWKWSRWGRNLLQSKIYLAAVEAAGGEVRAATEDFDASTTVGRFTRDQMLLIAELLSNQISDGWKEVQARRRDLGLTHGGPPPFGYRKAPAPVGSRLADQPHVHDPVTGPVVVELYDRYLAGRGPQTLVPWLNDAGHRTPRGNPFGTSTVARMLDNPYYAGYVRDGEEDWKLGAHEPLITEEVWRAYQRERERRRVVRPKSRQPKWHLGAGLTRCGRCGANLVLSSYSDPDPARRHYPRAHCARHNTQRTTCSGVSIARHKLDNAVALWLLGHLRDLADRAEHQRATGDQRDKLTKRLAELSAQEEKLLRGRAGAARLVALGEIPADDYRAAKRDADDRLRALADQVADVRAELDALDPDADVLDRFERATDGMTTAEWHGLLRRVIRAVDVQPDAVVIVPWRGDPATYLRRPSTHARTQPRVNGRFVHASHADEQ